MFSDKNVANNKTVSISGITLDGIDAGNYNIIQPTGLTANITKKDISTILATGINKTYDGTTNANVTLSSNEVFANDNIIFSGTSTFADKNVGTGKTVTISGSGNVAIYACEKATQLGAKVVTMSDSNGFVYDPEGIDLDLVKDIKEVRRGRIKEYVEKRPNATYTPNARPWTVACDIALPCATQNELDLEDAKALVANKVFAVCEGANMPTTPEAIHYLMKNSVFYAPGKASNAGGVACSGLEMSQNAQHLSWTAEEVDQKLENIMVNIFETCRDTAKEYGHEKEYVVGANIAGFLKVAKAMKAQGTV